MPQTVTLPNEGTDTSPEQIVDAWKTLSGALPWLPSWFAPEIVQDVMNYLHGKTSAATLEETITLRMGGREQCHFDIVTNVLGNRRVFVGPLGCVGVPGDGGAVNFHWKDEPDSRPQMLMTIY